MSPKASDKRSVGAVAVAQKRTSNLMIVGVGAASLLVVALIMFNSGQREGPGGDPSDRGALSSSRPADAALPEPRAGDPKRPNTPDRKSTRALRISENTITVPPVYFATAKGEILTRSYPTLREVAHLISQNKWVKKIRIEGHTDSRGNSAFNLKISTLRAESVLRFLVKYGVSAARLEAVGYGETQPIADNGTRKGRAQNRRVAFVIRDPLNPAKR